MQRINKIDRDLDNQFKAIAEKLPVRYYTARTEVIQGQQLIKRGKKEDSKGIAINTDAWYTLPVNYPINHLRLIRNAYKEGGQQAVEKYCKEFKNKATNSTGIEPVAPKS